MNFKGGTYEARRHHEGRDVNAAESLRQIPRVGVQQLSLNVHWTSANVNYSVDEAAAYSELHLVDSKDAKAIVLGMRNQFNSQESHGKGLSTKIMI